MVSTPQLRTKRLLIRPPAMDDVIGVTALFANPATTEFEPKKPQNVSPPVYAEKINKWAQSRAKGEDCILVIIKPHTATYSGDGEVIGIGGINSFKEQDGKRFADIGVAIDSSEWKKGYGTEALKATIEYALGEAKCDGILCDTMTANQPFRALMKSLRLNRFEKVITGSEIEQLNYSFSKEDWEAAKTPETE